MPHYLYLVRHGEQQDAEHGMPDGPLSPRGKRQATLIAERLGGVPFTSVYHSPLRRAEETAKIIDQEVKRLVKGGEDEARRILTTKLEDLHTLAKALLEYETLTGDEITNALKGIAPQRDEAETKRPAGPSVAVPISPRPDPEPA